MLQARARSRARVPSGRSRTRCGKTTADPAGSLRVQRGTQWDLGMGRRKTQEAVDISPVYCTAKWKTASPFYFSYTQSHHKGWWKRYHAGFPADSVVEDLPCNARKTGSIPGLGRFHMSWSNQACVPKLLSLRSTAHVLQLLSLCAAPIEAHVL